MKRHIVTIHEGKKQFKCDICTAEFTSKHGMKVQQFMKARKNSNVTHVATINWAWLIRQQLCRKETETKL